ncbi:hypothetical protein WJX81_002374 [Elliptochloris bilobata]|uniref:Fe2OG dioxygenase domain-containing protein n=1 Tax=Elliptochloris bilobata TaxID=381761 RepID=A0AAW1S3U1_9CHLO
MLAMHLLLLLASLPKAKRKACVQVCESALPGALLHLLQRGFAADAAFWDAHDYHDRATPFFSYLYDLGAYSLHHPVLSSVLYVSEQVEDASWGPTVIIDQTPRSELGRCAWLVPAICNCLVSFPGSLLHGVLPGCGNSAARRTSLIVAWWPAGKRPEPGPPDAGPARRLARGAVAPAWLASFPLRFFLRCDSEVEKTYVPEDLE